MNLLKIAWKNIVFKPLNTTLSLVLLSFGVGIISLLLLLEVQLQEQFDRNIKDIDMVLSAKGSPLQIILANVYHIDAPTGNIKYSDARRVMKHPLIEQAIPLAYGDNYKMFRIVGTEHSYPEHYEMDLDEGVLWSAPYEVTVGANVAQSLDLKLGDTFHSAHGLQDETDVHADHNFKVVGIFEANGTVIDQLILTAIESIWGVHDHAGEEVDPEDRPEDEITAVLLKKKNPLALVTLPNTIRDTNMQLALPAIEINRLTQNFGIGIATLRGIAVLIMFISFISVFISLYNSLKERKYELALMRTMGGTRAVLFTLILLEGLLMVFGGILIGLLISRLGLYFLSNVMENQFHYSVANMGLLSGELWLVLITIFVGILASFLPALKAVQMDISKTLSDG
jgi:putative ABC transport system permease protein